MLSHMSYGLNYLKGGYIGEYIRTVGLIKGDTRSLDDSPYDYESSDNI